MFIKTINFAELYKAHQQYSGRGRTPVEKWDARAERLSLTSSTDAYLQQLLQLIQVSSTDTILDVGCGGGSLALALAQCCQRVYALDYSAGMLKKVQQRAALMGVENILTLQKDWYESWDGVPVCDVVVASRSTLVEDMEAALLKLNAQATKQVYLTYPANPFFIDKAVADILGRAEQAFPDYFYIAAILHQLGAFPTVRFIEYPSRLAGAVSVHDFVKRVEGAEVLKAEQRIALMNWYENNTAYAQAGGEPTRWAVINWDPRALD